MTKMFLSGFVFITSLVIFVSSPLPAQAVLDPNLKECVQRGYDFAIRDGLEYCIFPDQSECLIGDFNQDKCGQNFKIKIYCVTQGRYTWDKNMCCRSLKYTEDNGLAQATCEIDYYRIILAKLALLVSQLFIGGIFFYKVSKQ